jgi:hypothetical protein
MSNHSDANPLIGDDLPLVVFRDEAVAYVRSQIQARNLPQDGDWVQVNLSLRSEEADLLTDLASRLGWTKRKTVSVALSALDLMASAP